MATKNVKNILKHSSVPGKIPTTTDLDVAELGYNVYDGKLYAKKNNGVETIVEIGGGGSGSSTLDGLSDVVITSPAVGHILAYDGSTWMNNPDFDILVNGMTIGVGGVDGGATDNNLAFGKNALNSLPADTGDFTRTFNVAIGSDSLTTLDHGQNNVAIGANSLFADESGSFNIAIGQSALSQVTTGNVNIGIGFATGGASWDSTYLTTGDYNTFIGGQIKPLTSSDSNSIVIGAMATSHGSNTVTIGKTGVSGTYLYGTIYANDSVLINTGGSTTSVGNNAAGSNPYGTGNTALGNSALQFNANSQNNTAVGHLAFQNLGKVVAAGSFRVGEAYKIVSVGTTDFTTIGSANNNVGTTFTATGVGSGTGTAAPTASERHTAIGQNAGRMLETGQRASFEGRNCGYSIRHALRSVFIGDGASYYSYDSQQNTVVGQGAAFSLNGQNNTAIGRGAFEQAGQVFAGNFITGTRYVIGTPGNTSWTSIGAANNSEGTVFIATGAGSGTGWAAEVDTTANSRNVAIGARAGSGASATSGSGVKLNDGVFIGYESKPGTGTDNNCIVIGSGAVGIGANTTVIGNSSTSDTRLFGNITVASDNVHSLGDASHRFSEVFAGTGTINTSDARHKTSVEQFTENELNAAMQLSKEIGTYKFLDAVQKKGDDARTHIGMTVQRVMEIMSANGLDPLAYGFICHDEWDAIVIQHPEVEAREETEEQEAIEYKSGWTEVVREAGDRYGFRVEELMLFIARGFEERLSRLESA